MKETINLKPSDSSQNFDEYIVNETLKHELGRMDVQPLVSVICLCYNQSTFVGEAIQSVLDQNYPNVELIVVDDGSTDDSKSVIRNKLQGLEINFIDLEENLGNCTAFNEGLNVAKGEFIIDLAADDILYPNRISQGLKAFTSEKIGVHFCDVMLLTKNDENLHTHYKRENGELIEDVPSGDIYKELIAKYFISPPSMMIRKEVFDELGGYDENLSYEDFDFWIRSSRNWEYAFTDQVLVGKRIIANSLSSKQFQFLNKHQRSTLAVCQKIKDLNQSKEEDAALKRRCWYEVRQCMKHGNFGLIPSFLKLVF